MQITTFSTCCVKGDYYSEFIPGVSSVTSLIDLFLKYAISPCLSKSTLERSHYFSYLEAKSLQRCVVLLIPVVGNLLIGLVELHNAKKIRELEKSAKETRVKTEVPDFYKEAADLGSPKAHYKYGKYVLERGRLQTLDRRLAKSHFKEAAIWGHQKAQRELTKLGG